MQPSPRQATTRRLARSQFGADCGAETPAKITAGRIGKVRTAFGELKIRHQNIFAGRTFVDDQSVLLDQPIHGAGKPGRVDWGCVPALFDPSFQIGVHLFLGFFDATEPLVSSVRVRDKPWIKIEQSAERAPRVGDNSQIDGEHFADLPRIFLDVNAARLGLDHRIWQVAILADQSAADGEQQIGLAPNRQIERWLALGNLKALRVIGRKTQKRIARLHDHRRADHLSEPDQLVDCAAFGNAAAGDDQRSAGLREKLGGFSHRFRIGADARHDA